MKKFTLLPISVFLANCLFLNLAFAQGSIPIPTLPKNPPKDVTVFDVVTKLGNLILFISGAIVVVMVIIGGIRYIVSAGNPTMVEGAKKTIVSALIALAIIILSTGILNTINWILNSEGAINPASVTGGSGGSNAPTGIGNIPTSLPATLQTLAKNNKCLNIFTCDYSKGVGYYCNTGGSTNDFYDDKGKKLCSADAVTAKLDATCQSLQIKSGSCKITWASESGSGSSGGGSGGVDVTKFPQFLQALVKDKECLDVSKCNYNAGSGYFCHTDAEFSDFYSDKGTKVCQDKNATTVLDAACESINVKDCARVWPTTTIDKSCKTNTDCGCGVRIGTQATCFFGNVNYIDDTKRCTTADFCTGVDGKQTTKCMSGTCKQVNK